MKIGENMNGFTVKNVRELYELGGRLWELTHDKTGAGLCWLERQEENRTFAICFKTLPEDSTGVFHILEHSVLCGSGKYPVKEPFVELLKSSLKTFLNAMTYSDKTVYPFSSRNDTDFMNLMDIYLDAVFDPEIYRKPEIFMQEGWHYEFEKGEPEMSGVVLNEMKGAYASPGQVLNAAMERLMFPDNCYRYVSGGDPEHIPELTYEQFIETHKKFYHPSNARIALVGNVDIEACLDKIDSFLSRFERRDASFDIPFQKAIPSVSERAEYEIGNNEPKKGRTIWSRGKLLGKFDETAKAHAASVICDYLAGDSDSPLKKAIIKTGLGQEVMASVQDGTQQSRVLITVWNTDEDKLDEVRSAIRTALLKVIENGTDAQRLSACRNSFAFRMRDKDSGGYPRSVGEAISMFEGWLYGGDPAQGLLVEETLKAAFEMLDGDGFIKLVRELFLDEENTVTVTLVPSNALGTEKVKREAERIKKISSSWTEEQRCAFIDKIDALHAWQQTPDSEEALASIPVLKLSDLADKPEALRMSVTEKNGVTVLCHDTGSKLVTLKAWFNASDVGLSDLPYLNLLSGLFGKAATKHHSSEEIQLLVKRHIGRLSVSPAVYPTKQTDKCRVFLCASAVCLVEEAGNACELLREILTETVFNDKALLKEQLDQNAMGMQMALSSNGHSFAMTRVRSRFSAAGIANEAMGGIELAKTLKSLAAKSEDELCEVLDKLASLSDRLIVHERLILSVTDNTPKIMIESIASAFPVKDGRPPEYAGYAPLDEKSAGLAIPAQVGYAAMGTNLKLHGKDFNGSWLALAGILNYVYLWSKIRVQGGAYGCGFAAYDSGDICYYTYRDPKPGHSLSVMDGSADFVRDFLASEPDLTGFILGAVSSLDPLLSSADKMNVSESRYFKGTSYEEVCTSYTELISTTADDILSLCGALETITKDDSSCVIAGKELFDGFERRIDKERFLEV